MFQRQGEVVSNRPLRGHGHLATVKAKGIPETVKPGHFFMLRRPGPQFPLLSRPFSVFDASPEKGELSFLYEVVGLGTSLMRECRPGDALALLGPLGNSFTPDPAVDRHVMIAGGVGIAPFYSLAKALGPKARRSLFFGARSRDRLLGVEEFEGLGLSVRTATDDGSAGHRGTVVDLLREELRERGSERWQLYACGPNPMLRAVCQVVVPLGLPCQVSLEARMACGFGACVGCAFPVKAPTPLGYRYALVCKDGTVFPAESLLFEV